MEINLVKNTLPKTADTYTPLMAPATIEGVLAFHRSMPGYAPTSLVPLRGLARELNVGGIYVKDESARFGLNAFKGLGGVYAMARYIAKEAGLDKFDYAALTSPGVRGEVGITFYTATDGNHGRGVAWAARQLGQRAVVYMPRGSRQVRLDNVRGEGAKAMVLDANYDECVAIAARDAKKAGGVLIQDTAWPGYEEIPAWIMQGYGTMAAEAAGQTVPPTHIFVQAGVGSMAAAVAAYFAHVAPGCRVIVVEPDRADCFYRTAAAGDGKPRTVEGDMPTMMAGLACGVPSSIGLDILTNHACAFLSCDDDVAAAGMRTLARPFAGDRPVVSGESGAVGLGALMYVAKNDGLRRELGIDQRSAVLLFSTEGDTDPDNYRRVVGGA